MTIKEQLAIIQSQTGLSQEKLAQMLGVSFTTLNSWMNGRSQPRFLAQKKIEELFAKSTGERSVPLKKRAEKFEQLLRKRKSHSHVLDTLLKRPDLADEFMLSLTYHSNRIEGSTLTMDETASVLFNTHPLANKTFVEQLEVKNHQVALNYLWKNLKKLPLDEGWILKMHGMLMNGIRDDAGSFVPTANYLKIPALMTELAPEFELHPKDFFSHLASVHARFEKIHPFSDGNGRIGRLLLNAMLLKADFPPALIREENRRLYYAYLKKAQLDEDFSLLEDFLMDAVLESYELLV